MVVLGACTDGDAAGVEARRFGDDIHADEQAASDGNPEAVADARASMPGPNRGRLAEAVAENARCEGCHLEQAREWRGSRHQRANVDAAYVEAFALEPNPFCRGCHAPESDARHTPPVTVSALGVGCVSCHV